MEGTSSAVEVDVLVVGAGPTGLALAAQLAQFGVRVRVIDRLADRAHESRALAVQPRTLEILQGVGVTANLVEHGNAATCFELHSRNRVSSLALFDIGSDDTAYPYLLFISQAETERFLLEHLDHCNVHVERAVELESFRDEPDAVVCTLQHADGQAEEVTVHYLVGCDGGRSTVRQHAGIGFEGSTYPQTFALGDVEADGDLDTGAAHAWFAENGLLFFFPLGTPATWRVLGMLPEDDHGNATSVGSLDLAELQRLVDSFTDGAVGLRDPAWLTRFRLHARQASTYRRDRVFVAGDAAHVHSPAGAQGMNTGIQDAWNLGWKLALVTGGAARDELLDTYDLERRPIGRTVVRFTDRAFTIATSRTWLIRTLRARVAPALLPLLARVRPGRARMFRALGELDLSYRNSPLAVAGDHPRRAPRPGDRLPDAPIERDGHDGWLLGALTAPTFHLLLCDRNGHPPWPQLDAVSSRFARVLTVHRLGPDPGPEGLLDRDGGALDRLGVTECAEILVRPDGYIATRTDDRQLDFIDRYLERWVPGAAPSPHVGPVDSQHRRSPSTPT